MHHLQLLGSRHDRHCLLADMGSGGTATQMQNGLHSCLLVKRRSIQYIWYDKPRSTSKLLALPCPAPPSRIITTQILPKPCYIGHSAICRRLCTAAENTHACMHVRADTCCMWLRSTAAMSW
mmetsp:Transcript_24230/g.52950  ORF Transcript_24230/g.52950 Transcript_24230/m.52950 type:complete len:122 (+) Transcript_24230:161-526(+)